MLFIGNRLIIDFLKKKKKLFINFFSQQCTTIVNNSSVPTNPTLKTENRLSVFEFSIGEIIKESLIVRNKRSSYE